jgi:hypothetical protein
MANHSPNRQVCMASLRNAEDDELDPQYDNEQLADVSADEPTTDAPQDEDEDHQRIRRVKNSKHFCSNHGSRVLYADWCHHRSNTPSSTTPTQFSDEKAAVSAARARATR